MPVGDKNFNDLVEHVQEIIKSLEIGYPRDSWMVLSDKLNKLFKSMCNKYKVDVGWRHECDINCPFKPDKDSMHPCCITRDWYRGYGNARLYSICDGARNINPSYRDLKQCRELMDDYRIFLNELVAGYWEKERKPKPPGTSAERPVYRVANEANDVVSDTSANTDVTTTAVTVSGGYNTSTILGPAPNPEPDDDGEDSEDDEDEQSEPWVCEYCEENFDTETEMDHHINRAHPWCDICDRRFSDDDAYQEHYENEHGGSDYVCDMCGDEFDSEDDLNVHLASVHPDTQAGRVAAANAAIAAATRAAAETNAIRATIPTPARPVRTAVATRRAPDMLVCNVCGDSFMNARSLRGHRLLDHTRHVHLCVVCNSAFETPEALGAHMAEHRR